MDPKQSDDQYSPEETQRRMENAIRRALNTPHKPNKDFVGKTERARKRRVGSRRPVEQSEDKSKLCDR